MMNPLNLRLIDLAAMSAVLLVLLASSCSVKNAPPMAQALEFGFLYVSAEDPYGHEIIGGVIYLDGELQVNRITPDTVQAEAGNHWVRVERASFSPDSADVVFIADTLQQLKLTLAPLNPGIGSIFVTASDSVSGQPIANGAIFLDGANTGLSTPITVDSIPIGQHTIGVGVLGFDYREMEVEITAGLNDEANLALPPVPWNGIRISTSYDPAQVCVDDELYDVATPWIVTGISDGFHDFSCYKASYATLSDSLTPSLQRVNLFTYGHQELTFNLELWSASVGYQEGKLAPVFALETDTGDTAALGAYRGRVVLVNFWFRDCPPCMEEFPDIQQVFAELGPSGFRVLAVNPMFNDTLEDLLEVRNLFALTFNLLMDESYATTLAYNANQFPTNVLVDQRGVVDWYTGSLTYADLNARVLALLNE